MRVEKLFPSAEATCLCAHHGEVIEAVRLRACGASCRDAGRGERQFADAAADRGQDGVRDRRFARTRITSGHAPKYLAALASAYLAAARLLEELRGQARVRSVPPGTIEQIAARLAAPATAHR